MQCRSKITLKRTAKGLLPLVPCSQCLHCRLNKRDHWAARILLESQSHTIGQFWTLTVSDTGLDTLVTQGPKKLYSNFLDALRRKESRAGNPLPIRSFGVLEHGTELGRPHFHLILWNHFNSVRDSTPYKPHLPRPRFHIEQWPHGHIDIQPLTTKSARYVAKYVTKFETDEAAEPIAFHAKRPALGVTGLVQHLTSLSRSPRKHWEIQPFIEIDGKTWALDQTMQKYFSSSCRRLGLRTSIDRHSKKIDLRVQKILERDHETWAKTDYRLRREATQERLFAHTLKQRELREFSTFQRALQLSAAAPSTSNPNAAKTATKVA